MPESFNRELDEKQDPSAPRFSRFEIDKLSKIWPMIGPRFGTFIMPDIDELKVDQRVCTLYKDTTRNAQVNGSNFPRYDLKLMSSLPEKDKNQAVHGKIYLESDPDTGNG